MKFQSGNQTYMIGSKMFPVASKSKTRLFLDKNTDAIELENLATTLDMLQFETGRCYYNARVVVEKAQKLGLDVQYYSGWLFANSTLPIHHAWAVYNGNIIDVSVSMKQMDLLADIDTKDPMWREKVAPKLRSAMQTKTSVTHDCVWGKVPSKLIYIGCPDNENEAKARFRHLLHVFPEHPSYKHKKDPTGPSELQKQLRGATT